MSNDINDLLGSGAKALGWDDIGQGVTVRGTILESKAEQCRVFKSTDLAFWDDGTPQMQGIITLQTDLRDPDNPDDDGVRALFTGPYRKPGTILGEIRQVLAKKKIARLEAGGTLAVQWTTGVGKSGDPRQFAVDYAAPDANNLLGDTPAPAPAAEPAPAPAAAPAAPSAGLLADV